MDAESKLRVALHWAAVQRPYFTTPLYNLHFREKPECPTLGVDPWWRCYWNPAFVDMCSIQELGTVLVHEINHLLLQHAQRSALRAFEQHHLWNVAADCEINDGINAPGERVMVLPQRAADAEGKGGFTPCLPSTIIPKRPLPDDELAEYYYEELLKASSKIVYAHHSCGSGAGDAKQPWEDGGEPTPENPGVSPGEASLIERQTAQAIKEHVSKERGNVPAGWGRWADQKLSTKIPWQRQLRSALRHAIMRPGLTDFTWRKINRRAEFYAPIHMPRMASAVPNLGVLVDTSGSMSDKDLARALAEIRGILDACCRVPITVAACDVAVHECKKVLRVEDVQLAGGGGTSMVAGIRFMQEHKPKIETLIVVTDGYTDWPSEHPAGLRQFIVVKTQAQGTNPPFASALVILVED